MLEKAWRDHFGGERSNKKERTDFRERGDVIVRSQTELSFHPEIYGNRRRQKQHIGKPTPQGRMGKGPTLDHVERNRCDTERVDSVSKPPHSKAVMAIPVPSARANLRKRRLISFCYRAAFLCCKGPIISPRPCWPRGDQEPRDR